MHSDRCMVRRSGAGRLACALLATLLLAGCALLVPEEEDLLAPADDYVLDSGEADFSVYVALGNSLTAGYQSAALYQSTQVNGYAALLARAMGVAEFELPLIADPGFYANEITGPDLAGHLRLVFEDGETVVEKTPWPDDVDEIEDLFLNAELAGPYHNLAVPGAVTYDLDHSLNAQDCYTAILAAEENTYFDIVLRNAAIDWTTHGGEAADLTQLDQAMLLAPTFLTLWIGNNELLLPATRGIGNALYEPAAFAEFYGEILAALADALPATEVVAANVPPVTAAPFFTTLDWFVTDAAGEPAPDPGSGQPIGLLAEDRGEGGRLGPGDLVTLEALDSLDAGRGADAWALVRRIMTDEGVDSATAAALLPVRYPSAGLPLGGELTLIAEEAAAIAAATEAYNTVIDTSCARRGIPVLDTHGIMAAAATGGVDYDGLHLTAEFVTGGLFSLDGIHPSSFGHAYIASRFIALINERYGANLRPPSLAETLP